MPAQEQKLILETMLDSLDRSNPALLPVMTFLSYTTGGTVQVTAQNLTTLMPILSTQQLMLALVGNAESGIPGMIALCGDPVMQGIYATVTESLKSLTITEESFTLLLQGNFISDEEFTEMESMLYKLAPQTDATYTSVLKTLGDAEKASPASINFYAIDFESKDVIEDFIEEYNAGVEEADKLKYINICFAIHSLNAYHPYSIPDILRMNNFDVTVTVKQVMTM